MQTITSHELRANNRSVVVNWLRLNGQTHRSQISKSLGMRLSTLARVVDGLIRDGWIFDIGKNDKNTEPRDPLLKFNGASRCVVGIDLGGTKIYGAVANLDGKILYETYFSHHQSRSEESFSVVCEVIDGLVKTASESKYSLFGIGIGVPGVTDPKTGMVTLAPGLDWQNFPLKARLREKYSLPIVVENDVNLAALGEAWFGVDEPRFMNLVLIAIGTGIGAGVVIDGEIYSGAHHLAGEIGYLVLDRGQLGKPYPEFGAFEQLASGSGIAERARIVLERQSSTSGNTSITSEEVFNAARQKELWAEKIITDTVDYIAQSIAVLQLTYDPEILILGGGVSHSADLLIEPIKERLLGTIPIVPNLRVSQLGYRAAVMGAVTQLTRVLVA